MANKKEDPDRNGVLSVENINACSDYIAEGGQFDDDMPWTATVDWWTSPSLAYAAGLYDGARLERERIAAEDEQLHREAVRAALASVKRVDRRRAWDRHDYLRDAA